MSDDNANPNQAEGAAKRTAGIVVLHAGRVPSSRFAANGALTGCVAAVALAREIRERTGAIVAQRGNG